MYLFLRSCLPTARPLPWRVSCVSILPRDSRTPQTLTTLRPCQSHCPILGYCFELRRIMNAANSDEIFLNLRKKHAGSCSIVYYGPHEGFHSASNVPYNLIPGGDIKLHSRSVESSPYCDPTSYVHRRECPTAGLASITLARSWRALTASG
jgi:hypothetical protein